jgi:hypothetical protein
MNRSRKRWRLVRHSTAYGWHVAASKGASIIGVQLSRYPNYHFYHITHFTMESPCA